MKTFIKTISMLVFVGLLLPQSVVADPATGNAEAIQGTPVPDTVITDLEFAIVDSSTIIVAIKFKPTADVLKNPPQFVLEYGEKASDYYASFKMDYDNIVDENGIIRTNLVVIHGLKADTVYHYHIKMLYLGIEFDSGDDSFKTASSL